MFDYRYNGLPNMLTAQMPFMPQNMLMTGQVPQPQTDPTTTGAIPQPQQHMPVPQGDMSYFPPAPDANRAPITQQDYQASLSHLQSPQAVQQQPVPAQSSDQSSSGMQQIAAFLQGLGRGNGVLSAIGGGMGAVQEQKQQNQTISYLTQRGIPEGEAQILSQSPQAVVQVLQNLRKGVDPKTALELQGLNLDNQIKAHKLANGSDLPDAIQSLQWRAQAAGLQQGTPEYQKFMATGGDKQSLVTVNTGNGEKFDEKLAELDAKAIGDVDTAGRQAIRNLGRINQLDQLLKASPSGLDAAWRQKAGEWGISTDRLDTLQAAQAAINSLVPEQRPAGSGPMSDADLDLFKQSLPRTINQPGGNQLIVNTMKGIAQYDAQGANIIQRLRARQISREEAFRLLNERKNPLEDFKASQVGGATQIAPLSENAIVEYSDYFKQ